VGDYWWSTRLSRQILHVKSIFMGTGVVARRPRDRKVAGSNLTRCHNFHNYYIWYVDSFIVSHKPVLAGHWYWSGIYWCMCVIYVKPVCDTLKTINYFYYLPWEKLFTPNCFSPPSWKWVSPGPSVHSVCWIYVYRHVHCMCDQARYWVLGPVGSATQYWYRSSSFESIP
jgi:hypothetical protein